MMYAVIPGTREADAEDCHSFEVAEGQSMV